LRVPPTLGSRAIDRHLGPVGCVLLLLIGHALLGHRYGVHGDELYFVACGKRLAAGYVDHPPFVPMIARAACVVGDCGVGSLRAVPLLARIATVLLTIVLVRRLRGGAFAQTAAGLAVVFAPAYLRMGKILNIPVFEPVFWLGGSLCLLTLARGGPRWWWLVLGGVVGAGALNKHTMLVWALGAAIGVLIVPALRRQLRTIWPWLGLVIAALTVMPNVLWQVRNQYASLEFMRAISQGMLAQIPRPLFVLGQLLYMHPVSALLWVPGLWVCLARPGQEGVLRAFGAIFVVAFGLFLVMHGKPYYLAPAYPPLFAVGAIACEWQLRHLWARRAFLGLQLSTGVALAVLTLPVLSLPRMDAAVGALFGRVVPPMALTHDLHAEYGWRELTDTVGDAWRSLSPDERARTEILTGNYSEAAALAYFGSAQGLPPASSGHMTYFLWGPSKPAADTVLAVGLPPSWLTKRCARIEQRALADHPLATPSERHVPIVLCRGLVRPIGELWPELERYDNSAAGPRGPSALDIAGGRH
jgi:hypothetical protein